MKNCEASSELSVGYSIIKMEDSRLHFYPSLYTLKNGIASFLFLSTHTSKCK